MNTWYIPSISKREIAFLSRRIILLPFPRKSSFFESSHNLGLELSLKYDIDKFVLLAVGDNKKLMTFEEKRYSLLQFGIFRRERVENTR